MSWKRGVGQVSFVPSIAISKDCEGFLRSRMSAKPQKQVQYYKNGINYFLIYKLTVKKLWDIIIVYVQFYTSVMLPLGVIIMISPLKEA